MNLYKTPFQPRVYHVFQPRDYYVTKWGYAAEKYLNIVQHIMNRAARIHDQNYDRKFRLRCTGTGTT